MPFISPFGPFVFGLVRSPKFEDAQARHHRYPDTFEVPSDDELDGLAVGDAVKVIHKGVRFWLIVQKRGLRRWVGTVDSRIDPALHGFGFEDRVRFERRHVCDWDPGPF